MSSLKRRYDTPAVESSKRQIKESIAGPTECIEEAHECNAPGKKKKWYAVLGGPSPGVHLADWAFIQPLAQGHNGSRCKSFPQGSRAAWEWYMGEIVHFPPTPAPPRQSQAQATTSPSQHHETQQQYDSDFNPEAAVLLPFELPAAESRAEAKSAPSSQDPHVHIAALEPRGEPPLSEEQEELVDIIVNQRKNVFYTGSAGVGKSTVLKAFRRRLAEKGLKVNVVAPTGRAALEIHGQTTWSYAGWVPSSMQKPLETLKRNVWRKTVKRRLRQTDVLVIDEISMVENLHLERLNAIMKVARNNEAAFGGVQIVVTGDFCQLPPVKPFQYCIECGDELELVARKSAYKCLTCGKIYEDEDKWAFRSAAWEEAQFKHVSLETIHRQNDARFIDILQKLRLGKPLFADERDLLLNHESETDKAVKLFSVKTKVKAENDRQFNKLSFEKSQEYDCVDNLELQPHHEDLRDSYGDSVDGKTLRKLAEHRYEARIQFKKGMLIILLANLNISAGLVNGSQGTVIGFSEFWDQELAVLPDAVKISDLQYKLEGDYKDYRAKRIFDFMQSARQKSWPVVRFLNGVEMPITAECYPQELGDESPVNPRYSLISRTQIPLMAGWAMTIHKAQGMTLNRVEIDLGRTFEEGQAYVALSRVRNLKGLKLIDFPDSAQKGCNEEVKQFLLKKLSIE